MTSLAIWDGFMEEEPEFEGWGTLTSEAHEKDIPGGAEA